MEISFLSGELFFTAIWVTVRVILRICRKKTDRKREVMLLIMYVYLAVLIRMTFFPFFHVDGKIQPLVIDPDEIFPLWINPVPVVGNAVMFIPSGIILPALYRSLRRLGKAVSAGAALSLCIELLQLPVSSRATDIDDLILNTLGCAIGYGIYVIFKKMFSWREKHADIQP